MNDLQDRLKDKAYRQIHQAVSNRKVKKEKEKKNVTAWINKIYASSGYYELNFSNSLDLENM